MSSATLRNPPDSHHSCPRFAGLLSFSASLRSILVFSRRWRERSWEALPAICSDPLPCRCMREFVSPASPYSATFGWVPHAFLHQCRAKRASLPEKNQVSARDRLASLAEKARNYGDVH